MDCLKRERDISINYKPILSGMETAFRFTPALTSLRSDTAGQPTNLTPQSLKLKKSLPYPKKISCPFPFLKANVENILMSVSPRTTRKWNEILRCLWIKLSMLSSLATGNPERARSLHLDRSGSQSQRMI